MPEKILFSTGQVADLLGIARYQLSYRFEKKQIPEPPRVCGRRAYSEKDVRAIRKFFEQQGMGAAK